MNPATASRPSLVANLLSGVAGGLVVLGIGATLIATDVIDAGDEEREVVRQTLTRPAANNGGDGRTVTDVYRDVGPGVVFIRARGGSDESPFGFPTPERGEATGSGFVIDEDGYVLTNDHVVEGSDDVSVRFTEAGGFVDAEVKGRDPSSDLALLKVDPDDAKLDPVPFGDSSKVRVGDPAVAIGNPFGLERTVTTGIVSAVQREISSPNEFTIAGAIQTDASINPGNSGGPLLDVDGRLIGINSQIATGGGGGSVGIGFAVPSNLARKVVDQLKDKGKVERAFIGVTTTPISEQLADDLNLPVDRGAMVVDVFRGSPADKAGLRAGRTRTTEGVRIGGDVIVEVNGRKVSSPEDVVGGIQDKDPGDEVEVVFYRGDDKKTTELKLTSRPDRLERERAPQPSPEPGPEGGIPLP